MFSISRSVKTYYAKVNIRFLSIDYMTMPKGQTIANPLWIYRLLYPRLINYNRERKSFTMLNPKSTMKTFLKIIMTQTNMMAPVVLKSNRINRKEDSATAMTDQNQRNYNNSKRPIILVSLSSTKYPKIRNPSNSQNQHKTAPPSQSFSIHQNKSLNMQTTKQMKIFLK
jgi:hypothetical protein